MSLAAHSALKGCTVEARFWMLRLQQATKLVLLDTALLKQSLSFLASFKWGYLYVERLLAKNNCSSRDSALSDHFH